MLNTMNNIVILAGVTYHYGGAINVLIGNPTFEGLFWALFGLAILLREIGILSKDSNKKGD